MLPDVDRHVITGYHPRIDFFLLFLRKLVEISNHFTRLTREGLRPRHAGPDMRRE